MELTHISKIATIRPFCSMFAEKENKNVSIYCLNKDSASKIKIFMDKLLSSMLPKRIDSISSINYLKRKVKESLSLADPNHTDRIAKQTPIFYAAREGNLEMCKILIEAGCDLTYQDASNKNLQHYAKKSGKTDVVEYLAS